MYMYFEPLDQFEIVYSNVAIFIDINWLLNSYLNYSFYYLIFLCFLEYCHFLLYFFNFSYWSFSLYRTLFFLLFGFFLAFGTNKVSGFVWPRYWQIFIELLYRFLASVFKDLVGYRGQVYFPFLATVFLYVFFLNIFGMIPYEGAITSQLIFNLSLSFTLLFVLTIIGFVRQKKRFLNMFLPPKGLPKVLIPLLCFIECVSYIARGVSLGVRLFANIMAGHTLLFIFSSFILKVNIVLAISLFLVIFIVTFLEFFIASLQAYVFYILVVMYFRDSIEVSH
jgi:ATP synthase subunit 6